MHLASLSASSHSLADIEKCRYVTFRYQRRHLITNLLEQANPQRESVVWNIGSYISYA